MATVNQTSATETTLSAEHLEVLGRYGSERDVAAGDVLFAPGDPAYDLVVVLSGVVEVVGGTSDQPVVVASMEPGSFVGEFGMITGQRAYMTARVREAGRVLIIPNAEVRHILDREAEVADIILAAFIARRRILRLDLAGAATIRVFGSRYAPGALALRGFLARSGVPHRWIDLDEVEDPAVKLARYGARPQDVPVVVTPTALLRRATPGRLAEHLGLTYVAVPGSSFDLVVIGAGPAGLAASVYGASEGLDTVTIESVVIGGQAGTSSRIENYLGFPQGLPGQKLADLASMQAQRFGARLTNPCQAVKMRSEDGWHVVQLADGSEIPARAVVLATGAEYRRPAVEGWERLETQGGIFYAATETEGRLCAQSRVAVIGGGNSAGQAALFLASKGCEVRILIRGEGLSASMSRYLIERIDEHPHVTVECRTEVRALHGDERLAAVTVERTAEGRFDDLDVAGLFCFIGAVPATGWLGGCLATDGRGFLRTDRDLLPTDLGAEWEGLDRDPLPYETSVPGVFAAGDVRSGSVKRVAAAVGEGSTAVRSVHQHLALVH